MPPRAREVTKAQTAPRPAAEGAALVVATLASFLTPFMGSSINVALPAIGREFGLDAVTLSWVPAAFLLAAAAFLVPLGKAADIHGRKRVFAWGLVVYTATSLLCALAPSATFLIGARVAQGVGGAMVFGTSVAILTSVVPSERRGAALGLNVAAVYLGLSLGPFLGGVLTDQFGWRRIFELNAVLALLTAGIVAAKLPGDWAEERGVRFDLTGSAIYGLGLAAVMYGLSRLPSPAGATLLLAGLGAMAGFVRWELKAASPVLEMALLRDNRAFALSNLAALVNYAATYAVGFLLSLHLQYVRGMGAQEAGLVLLAQPIVQAAVSPLAGRLSDRTEPRIVATSGMALIVVGLALLSFLSGDTPPGRIVGCLALLGCGFGLFASPNTNAVMGSVEKRSYGVASAMLATMRLVGQMLSMGTAMLILGVFVGPGAIAPDSDTALLAATRTAFGLFAALCVAGAVASLARGRTIPSRFPDPRAH